MVKGGRGTGPRSATVPAQSTPLGKNVSLSSMVGFGGLILEGSHHFGREVWNRGASNRVFQGRGAGLRYGSFITLDNYLRTLEGSNGYPQSRPTK